MIVGLGTDIVELNRIDDSLKRLGDKFALRILTTEEFKAYQNSPQKTALLARRFAAKEAAVKALGIGIGNGISWQHVHISHTELGAPLLSFSDYALQVCQQKSVSNIHLSISDERHYAVATVILES